ncbi:hypothetical protein PVB96_002083 [Salmonella enterica subsp. enterica serovar Mbandaka]|nr:hypothetical protein [Salmonella enterica subsp. enterica serovar Mbandaka]
MNNQQLYIMAVEGSNTLLKVGLHNDPVEQLFEYQSHATSTITLMVVSDSMTFDKAYGLYESIMNTLPTIPPELGTKFHNQQNQSLLELTQLENIMTMIGNVYEIMKRTIDYSPIQQTYYNNKIIQKQCNTPVSEIANTMPEFKSTGNKSVDDVMMKIRGGRTESFKL